MIVKSYKTSPTVVRINIDIALSEIEDFIRQSNLLLTKPVCEHLGIQYTDLEQINALRTHFAKVYDQSCTPNSNGS